MGVAIHWFRKGLRLHDNPALLQAISSSSNLLPLFILDPWFLKPTKVGANRLGFMLETLSCLDAELRLKGSCLVVAFGNPVDVLKDLMKSLSIELLTFERDTEPYAVQRDERVVELAESVGVKVHRCYSHTLFDPDKLLRMNGGKAPLTMTSFQKLVAKAGTPQTPLETPKSLPSLPAEWRENENLTKLGSVNFYSSCPMLADLKEYGYDPVEKTSMLFAAGEIEAMKRMEDFLAQEKRVTTFEKPKTSPTALEPDTTALSPYLKTGSLSCRLFYSRLKQVYKSAGKHTQPPVSLEGQLLWREMSYLIGYSTPNFNRMVGNPVCTQIPWRTGPEADKLVEKWEFGQTGFPAVDAVMNQLRYEGWMHHLARHLVACFLTRGDLWVSWEKGRDVFERYLIDADWSINNFSWHWLSCSAFFRQYFRCYGPATFFKKTDPTGSYIRKHVPCLKKFPDKYIYEPWMAPKNVQSAAGCIIGEDYPRPMVDHPKVSKQNMEKMKMAYAKEKEMKEGSENEGGEPSAKKQKV